MKKIKVLIVEDSKSIQQLLAYIISKDSSIVLSGLATNGEEALKAIKADRPDVILMDIIMPVMDGIEATKRIMEADPIPILIISSYYNSNEIHISMEALQAGAVALFEKPKGISDPKFSHFEEELIRTIKTVAEVKLSAKKHFHTLPKTNSIHQRYSIVAIGASLGGPQALISIFSSLPPDFPLPILVVQHISQGFVSGLVDWLNRNTSLKVVIAKDKEQPLPGHIYLPPSQYHLELHEDKTIKLLEDNSSKGPVPSVNKLFGSVARIYGPKAIGILLTGMGSDGADSLLLMKQKGALTIVQDEATCMVFGMPKEAIQKGAAAKILALPEIAPYIKNTVY